MAKPVKLDHHHFAVAPDDPSFDLDRARQAHADVMRRWDDPKEGDAFKALMLHAIQNATATEIEAHRKEIQAFLDRYFSAKHEATSKAIVKAYVGLHYDAARAGGQIGKDDGTGDFWRHQPRDAEGQWSRINFGAQQPGHVDVGAHRELLRHAATISAATTGHGRVVYHVEDRKGRVRQERLARHKVPRLRRGEKLVGHPYGEYSGNDLTAGQHSYNLIGELGGGDTAARRVGGGAQATSDFARAWDAHTNENYGTNKGQAYSRIEAGANALHTIAGGNPKAQVAIAIGRYVGRHGAEAEKVLGPHARKSAYKYRGVERVPRDLPRKPEGMSEQAYRDAMVARISRNIPTRAVHDLNLASGYTAPSHGYLLDAKGNVAVEAHGYGDDHYLPFRLSGLTRLRNGSYIRTRGTGGPTTEDVYAASISGAREFTVTSRQGTYTLAFDPSFMHHKRFGDIALGMSKRYGKILDAVASGKVYAKGEVTDRAYRRMYEEALTHPDIANSPDREQKAQELANTMREQQETRKGRQLSLNGEGYDYALKALASQYPYYLHYADREREGEDQLKGRGDHTGYFGPNDRRYWEDPEAEEGGHLSRIGNRGERDSGYVKARHLKSADALVGYFDPTIEGTAHRLGAGPDRANVKDAELSGSKLRGDVVHYQNWRHNPYNTPADQGEPGRGSRPAPNAHEERQRNHEVQESLRRAQAAASGGQPGGTHRQNPGQGVASAATEGLSAEQAALLAKVRAVVKHNRDNGEAPHRQLAGWAQDPDAFKRAYEASPANAQNMTNFVNNRFKPVAEATRLTNAPAEDGIKADEVADAAKSDSDDQRRYNELDAHLNTPYHVHLRSKLQDAGKQMWDEKHGEGMSAEADPSANWDHYHHVDDSDGETVRALAFGKDDKAREDARHLMSQEVEMDDVHARLGKPHGEVYVPHAHRAQERREANIAERATEKVATGEEAFAERHNKALVQAVTHLRDRYAARAPHEGEDERVTRRRKLGDISFALDQIQESPEHMARNSAKVAALIKDHPDLAKVKVLVDHPKGGGKTEVDFADVAQLYPQPTGPQHRKVHKAATWTVRKSGREYVLSAG